MLKKYVSPISILLVLAGLCFTYNTATAALPVTDVAPSVIKELLDRRHAATVVSRKKMLERTVVPIISLENGIDRRALLKDLFERITVGETTDQGRIEAWVRYLQDRIAHPKWAPLLDNGQTIYDPYWILKNRIAQCGQTNRVVADGLDAAGFQVRIVQLKAHVAAEVLLNGKWCFLDADWLSLGEFVRHKDGTLASAVQIHQNLKLLDGLHPEMEFRMYEVDVKHSTYEPYTAMFSVPPYYYVKTSTRDQERNAYYGWNYYKTIRE